MAFEKVLRLDDLEPGTAKAVELGGEPICVVRRPDGEVRAVHDTCSHQQWSLADGGWVGANDIECSLHGSDFDLDSGAPRSLPATDAIPTFACRVVGGDVEVDVEQQTNDAKIPDHF